jgi:hypothetical protein
MLHAGLGLAFAQERLAGIGPFTGEVDLRRRLQGFLRLCLDNSLPGYEGAAFESLGLVTHLFYPRQVAAVDRQLGHLVPPIGGYFWHGVGRSLYFDPVNFLPCSLWQAYETARREAPGERARLNAWAGVTWAAVLVNERQPWILDELLIQPHGEELAAEGALTNGLASANIMRFDTTPRAPFIEAFCRYRPAGGPRAVARWDTLVRAPCERALRRDYPVLKAHQRLGAVFEFRNLPALVGALEAA